MLRCIAIDDEPLGLELLEDNISKVPYLQLIASFNNSLDAVKLLQEQPVDLVFLDIQMPGLTGLQLIESIQQKPMFILVTAYEKYALDSYNLNVVDYLVKPVSFDRFLKAVLKAKEYYEVRDTNTKEAVTAEYFFIKADNKLVKILFDDVLYAEALQNYVIIHTAAKKHMTYLTFKLVEDYLPPDKFLKVHKSYIVAASKIDSIEGNDIRIGQQHIPISRNQKDEVMEKLLKGKFLKR